MNCHLSHSSCAGNNQRHARIRDASPPTDTKNMSWIASYYFPCVKRVYSLTQLALSHVPIRYNAWKFSLWDSCIPWNDLSVIRILNVMCLSGHIIVYVHLRLCLYVRRVGQDSERVARLRLSLQNRSRSHHTLFIKHRQNPRTLYLIEGEQRFMIFINVPAVPALPCLAWMHDRRLRQCRGSQPL